MHDFHWVPGSTIVVCRHCDVNARLATSDESRLIRMFDSFSDSGPWGMPNNIIAVPVDFTIWGA